MCHYLLRSKISTHHLWLSQSIGSLTRHYSTNCIKLAPRCVMETQWRSCFRIQQVNANVHFLCKRGVGCSRYSACVLQILTTLVVISLSKLHILLSILRIRFLSGMVAVLSIDEISTVFEPSVKPATPYPTAHRRLRESLTSCVFLDG